MTPRTDTERSLWRRFVALNDRFDAWVDTWRRPALRYMSAFNGIGGVVMWWAGEPDAVVFLVAGLLGMLFVPFDEWLDTVLPTRAASPSQREEPSDAR